ncbi:molybdopterin-dependent oxidoreductase [Amycolatopsis sp. GM8]|uniref:molybdopterin-containing oxidoreductase family protein n=1 Tax=Amycolatopsis sp. GM8 TaxID=2896530 RepID=UPI001F2CB31C|nr:molybdopterin dinucleotide binding domain-containing protein [Amycolatopsis sp. GM8]
MATVERKPSFCRVCQNFCPVDVHIADGAVQRITGAAGNEIYRGYTCVKGRSHVALYNHPERVLHSLKKLPDGRFARIPTVDAIDEIATRLSAVIDREGPRAFALFMGTYVPFENPINLSMVASFIRAVGSPMLFTTSTIDQPGKPIAKSFHGAWMAPSQAFSDPDVALVVGSNPLVSLVGPAGFPMSSIRKLEARGGHLIVLDPRKTETAKRASIHLQLKPGEDAAVLAGMIRVIIDEDLADHEFIAENVDGYERLRAAVAPFTPEYVARRAGIDAADLTAAARLIGSAPRGYGASGTGANMSGHGPLVEYLVLCLSSIRGHWTRAGERLPSPSVLTSAAEPRAQARPPFPDVENPEKLRVRGLTASRAGMPTSALADEILTPGAGQVRAMISTGANPAKCIPDQLKVVDALRSLELLVQVDVQMSPTARLADYVIAARLPYEMPGTNGFMQRMAEYTVGAGLPEPFGQYTDAVVEPPPGADVIEQWRFFYLLAQRLGLELTFDGLVPDGSEPTPLDMDGAGDAGALMEIVHAGSRIPLEEVRKHPQGALFPEPAVFVAPKEAGWTGRLDVGNETMMGDLAATLTSARDPEDEAFPLRLLSRRLPYVMNSPTLAAPPGKPAHNRANFHPGDLAALGIAAGTLVEIRSPRAAVVAVADSDPTMRPGTVSMTHSFGDLPGEDDDVWRHGTSIGRLIADDVAFDPYSGQPRMSNIPIRVTALGGAG